MCHARSGRTSPKRAGAALSLHHQGRPCGSPVLRSGALSWHLSTCGTNETDFSLSLPCIRIRVGTEAVDWAGPSVLPRSRPLLPLSLFHLCPPPPPKVGAPSEIRVCRAIALWTGLGPRCFLPSFLCFSLSIFLSLSLSLSSAPLPTESGRPLKSGSAWRWNCGQGWALGPYSLPSPVSLGPPPY